MVCIPCIFVGLAIVIWCKYLEPCIKPIYEKLCQYYPPLRSLGNQIGVWGEKLERFGEKIGIRVPQLCPMPKKKTDASKSAAESDKKLYPDLKTVSDDTNVHQRTVPLSSID